MTPHDEHGERLYTAEEIAERAGLGHRTFLSYLSDTRSPRAPKPDGHVGRTPVWRASTVDEWMDSRGT